MTPFDLCILTAANRVQAEGYRVRLQWRKSHGLYPETEFMVVADPDGERIGSGGSTLYVLHQLYERRQKKFDAAFAHRRILIIHSGGDSRRLPAYASCGKIFTPLPTRSYQCLFDIMMQTYAALPPNPAGQVLIAAGDVLLSFSADGIQFAEKGITGVAYPDEAQVAEHHGVFVPARTSTQTPVRVKNFLQKPSRDDLYRHHALDYQQRAWIDTGIVHLALDAVYTLVHCSKLLSRTMDKKKELNLYEEVPFALLGKTKIPDGQKLGMLPYHVFLLAYCGFFHIGRSREFLYNLHTLTPASALHGFQNGVRSNAVDLPQIKKAYIYNSLIHTRQATIKSPVLLENCHLNHPVALAGNNLVTNIQAEVGAIRLASDLGLTLLPLQQDQWTALVYGLDDHFKTHAAAQDNLFMNQPIALWLQQRQLKERDLWPAGATGDLWHAQLFPVCTDPAKAVKLALSLQLQGRLPRQWLSAQRRSLHDLVQSVDHKALLRQQEEIVKAATLHQLQGELVPDSSWTSQELLGLCTHPTSRSLLEATLARMTRQQEDPLFRSRLYFLRSRIIQAATKKEPKRKGEAERLLDQAFSTIRVAVGKASSRAETASHQGFAIRSDEVVWACSPARLDFAGGWSDTPPYCMEQGGAVLNAAVTLNGQYPIQVIAKILGRPIVRINSIDLGASAVIRDLSQLHDFTDPSNWLSLPKAAMIAAGIFSNQEHSSLSRSLQQFGGGIDLTLFSALPAGSGLGTSSILGAAAIAALSRMFGIKLTLHDLFHRTSYMEQLMTTGGGWQDQIGGVVGGVKLIQSQPGYDQTPTLSWTQLVEGTENLTLLYYTGLRRMAKNILRQVVSRYLDRDPEAMATLRLLKATALEMKEALDHRRMDRFGNLIDRVWQCNKRLDQGSTTEAIDSLIHSIAPYAHGVKLLGAGGGGFLFMVAKSPSDRDKIQRRLTQKPPNDRARFFNFAVDSDGLVVHVL